MIRGPGEGAGRQGLPSDRTSQSFQFHEWPVSAHLRLREMFRRGPLIVRLRTPDGYWGRYSWVNSSVNQIIPVRYRVRTRASASGDNGVVTSRLLLLASILVRVSPRLCVGVHLGSSVGPGLLAWLCVKCGVPSCSVMNWPDTAISCLPRLGSGVRIPSPAPGKQWLRRFRDYR